MNSFSDALLKIAAVVAIMIVAGLFAMAIDSSMSEDRRTDAYKERCINAGGVFIDGRGMDFCVKEFMPLGEK